MTEWTLVNEFIGWSIVTVVSDLVAALRQLYLQYIRLLQHSCLHLWLWLDVSIIT